MSGQFLENRSTHRVYWAIILMRGKVHPEKLPFGKVGIDCNPVNCVKSQRREA